MYRVCTALIRKAASFKWTEPAWTAEQIGKVGEQRRCKYALRCLSLRIPKCMRKCADSTRACSLRLARFRFRACVLGELHERAQQQKSGAERAHIAVLPRESIPLRGIVLQLQVHVRSLRYNCMSIPIPFRSANALSKSAVIGVLRAAAFRAPRYANSGESSLAFFLEFAAYTCLFARVRVHLACKRVRQTRCSAVRTHTRRALARIR